MRDVAASSCGTHGRFDDMWLLSNVHIEDVGTSRKWVNWRDLYYPGGFIKCFPTQFFVLLPPPILSLSPSALLLLRFLKNKGFYSAMAHEVQPYVHVFPKLNLTPALLKVAQRDDVLFRHSAFVRGEQHAVDVNTHVQMLSDLVADPKMTWTNAAMGLCLQAQLSSDAARDQLSDSVVRHITCHMSHLLSNVAV